MSKSTTVLTVVLLTIQRSSEVTITDSVFEHEVPILELIHGEENVNVVNDDYHAIEVPNNATQEYQRLISKYGDKYRPVIDQVFRGGARDVAKETSMDLGKDSFVKQSEAIVNSKLPPRPGEKDYEASAGASTDAGTGTAADVALTAAELKAELTKRKVEFKGNASKAELQALLDDAKKADTGTGTLGG